MLNIIKRLRISLKYAKIAYRDGGFCNVNITYSSYPNLLKGKKILITGGGSGIGLAIAKKCASCGGRVLIIGRNENKLQEAVAEIGEKSASYIVCDISNIAFLDNVLDECIKKFGAIDILINNAGISPSKFWGEVDEEEFERIYSTNLKGHFFLTQTLVNIWNTQPQKSYRKILFISSQGGFVGATYPYRMAKWDIRGLTEGLGRLLIDKK